MTLLYRYLLHVFLFFPSFPSLGTGWLQSLGHCNSPLVSVSLSLGLGVSVRSDSGSSPLDPTPLTEDRYSATSQEPRKKASLLFNSLCYDVMLLWAYILFQNNSSNGTGKKKKKNYMYFFIITFQHPLRTTAPLAFAYTAYVQGRLWL